MSLAAIRQARLERQKPGCVMVVLDDLPRWFDYDPGTIVVRPGDSPAAMDWRPMVGVLTAVFTLGQQPAQTLAVLDALQAAGAVVLGTADRTGVYPLLVDSTEDHERLLQRAWDILCRS